MAPGAVQAGGPDEYGVFKGHKTSVAGVFAAGDCRSGQSLVVKAMAEGKSVARAVNAFLRPYELKDDVPHPTGGIMPLQQHRSQALGLRDRTPVA